MADNLRQTPDRSVDALGAPAWTHDAGLVEVLGRGMLRALRVPGWILLVSASGFGVLAQDSGLSLGESALVTVAFYGLPAQVAIADQIARDASFWVAALAVALTGIRLLPMTVAFMPYLGRRDPGRGVGIAHVVAVHFLAVTAWFEGIRALPPIPERLRLVYFLGIGFGLMCMALAGTVAGFLLVGVVPPIIGAVLLFVSPSYFLLALVDAARVRADIVAIVLGCMLAPVFYLWLPDFDLLLTGVLGGTIAYVVGRHHRGLSWLPGFGDRDDDA